MAGKAVTLFLGTHSGVYTLKVPNGQPKLLALPNHYITHVFYAKKQLLAGCPVLGNLHSKYYNITKETRPTHVPGLHRFKLEDEVANDTILSGDLLCEADVRSCIAFATTTSAFNAAIGIEPADVLVADLSGPGAPQWRGRWAMANVEGREKWSFPVPPHIPHVLSIDHALDMDGTRLLLVGVEVGGVLVSRDDGLTWEPRSNGLCPDVHSVRPDPHHPTRWYAVTGGALPPAPPGGLYVTEDAGRNWMRLTKGLESSKYMLGITLDPYHKDHMIITSGNRPPSIGFHAYFSDDAGCAFEEITDSVISSLPESISREAATRFTPPALFTQHGPLIALSSGDIIMRTAATIGAAAPLSGGWQVIGQVPTPVTCMMSDEEMGSPSSIAH